MVDPSAPVDDLLRLQHLVLDDRVQDVRQVLLHDGLADGGVGLLVT